MCGSTHNVARKGCRLPINPLERLLDERSTSAKSENSTLCPWSSPHWGALLEQVFMVCFEDAGQSLVTDSQKRGGMGYATAQGQR